MITWQYHCDALSEELIRVFCIELSCQKCQAVFNQFNQFPSSFSKQHTEDRRGHFHVFKCSEFSITPFSLTEAILYDRIPTYMPFGVRVCIYARNIALKIQAIWTCLTLKANCCKTFLWARLRNFLSLLLFFISLRTYRNPFFYQLWTEISQSRVCVNLGGALSVTPYWCPWYTGNNLGWLGQTEFCSCLSQIINNNHSAL